MAREVTQPLCVLILWLAVDKGGKKHAELHLVHLLATAPFATTASHSPSCRPYGCHGRRWYGRAHGVSTPAIHQRTQLDEVIFQGRTEPRLPTPPRLAAATIYFYGTSQMDWTEATRVPCCRKGRNLYPTQR